jgi:ATP-dependent DNA ligase
MPLPATQPDFVPPMLCTLVERAPEGAGWVHEVKLDGYRMQAIVAGDQARLMTRGGHDWTHRFPETAAGFCQGSRQRTCLVGHGTAGRHRDQRGWGPGWSACAAAPRR